jgi:superoxide dismutase, Fe-Mn family
METFTLKTFTIPKLAGISEKNIEEHLKLYKGYVTNTNLVLNKIKEYKKNPVDNIYILSELYRRFSFEWGGMRNHEVYFSSLCDEPKKLKENSPLKYAIAKYSGNFENWLEDFKTLALTRGVGWAMLYYDKETNNLFNTWVDEQHLGHLVGASPILCLDMWEHAYVYDYPTSEKKKYIEVFFANLNWEVIEENFKNAK